MKTDWALPGCFAVGLACMSFLIGLLIGVSNSPVAGVAVTGVIAFLVALTGYRKSDSGDRLKLDEKALRAAGQAMTLFTGLVIIGIVIGVSMRASGLPGFDDVTDRTFPWAEDAAPDAFTAVDWLIVQEKLLGMGYTPDQVGTLYSLSRDGWSGPIPLSSLFSGVDLASPEQIPILEWYFQNRQEPPFGPEGEGR